ncbi:MAG TPA: hypothetical protein VGE91_06220 [Solirubrobacterales bacterium]|jgi:hypothetical protein
MAGAGEGGPVRLAILVGSIAALSLVGLHSLSGGASASRRFGGPNGPGKIVALAARRSLPASVGRALARPRARHRVKLRVPVKAAGTARLGELTYTLGGVLADGRPTDLIQSYNARTRRSRIVGRLPRPVSHGAAITLDRFVYLLGGLTAGSPTRAIIRFAPGRGTVVIAGHLPVPASGGDPVASRSRRGYLVGAHVPGDSALNLELTLRTRGH